MTDTDSNEPRSGDDLSALKRFTALTKQLLNVPKKEVDEQRKQRETSNRDQ